MKFTGLEVEKARDIAFRAVTKKYGPHYSNIAEYMIASSGAKGWTETLCAVDACHMLFHETLKELKRINRNPRLDRSGAAAAVGGGGGGVGIGS